MQDTAPPGGWIALLALLVGFFVRLIKSERVDAWLANMGLPLIPKRYLPWIAMALGALGGTLEAMASGSSLKDAAIGALYGLLSGALAVAGNETLGQAVANANPKAGRVVFAKSPTEKP